MQVHLAARRKLVGDQNKQMSNALYVFELKTKYILYVREDNDSNRKYKDYVYRKMLVQECLKK